MSAQRIATLIGYGKNLDAEGQSCNSLVAVQRFCSIITSVQLSISDTEISWLLSSGLIITLVLAADSSF